MDHQEGNGRNRRGQLEGRTSKREMEEWRRAVRGEDHRNKAYCPIGRKMS